MKVLLLLLLALACAESKPFSGKREAVHLRVLHSTADKYELELKMFGKLYRLNMELEDIFAENFKLLTMHGKEMREIEVPNKDFRKHFFVDRKAKASLMIVKNSDGVVTIQGLVDAHIVIENEIDPKTKSVKHSAHKNNEIEKSVASTKLGAKYDAKIIPKEHQLAVSSGTKQVRAPDSNTAETFLTTDYDFFLAFNSDVNACFNYLSIFYNEVNRYLQTISIPQIQVRLNELLIIQNLNDQSSFIIKEPSGGITSETLARYGTFMYNYKDTYKYDISILQTGCELGDYDGTTGAWTTGLAGIAYLAGACNAVGTGTQSLNVGLGEDHPAGGYIGCETIAHETGHLIGATHDGDPAAFPDQGQPSAEGCPWDQKYIMSYENGDDHTFYFSTCSQDQVHWLLNYSWGSCLTDTPNGAAIDLTNTLPGTLVSLDDQCKNLFGSEYYAPNKDASVCTMLYCYKDGDQYMYSFGPALEGSSCGSNLWCVRGQCVPVSK